MRYSTLPVFFSVASAAVHTIQVGPTDLTFVPETVTAVEGDTVIFELFPGHDVVQGDGFGDPCETGDDGFYSGPYSGSDRGQKKFVVNVTSNEPTYFYCSLSGHCMAGMVGGINIPNSGSNTIQEYRKAAAGVQRAETPNQVRGGQLLDDAQIASLTGSASGRPTSSASPSGSGSSTGTTSTPTSGAAASASASASGSGAAAASTAAAADFAPGKISGFAAMVLGSAAWFL